MRMKVKRRDVLRAIRTENLINGSFFGEWGNTELNTCSVCAVGAVIRASYKNFHNLDHTQASDLAVEFCRDQVCSGDEDVELCLKKKNYLGALSVYFETLMEERVRVTPNIRAKVANFVKKNFPKEFTTGTRRNFRFSHERE